MFESLIMGWWYWIIVVGYGWVYYMEVCLSMMYLLYLNLKLVLLVIRIVGFIGYYYVGVSTIYWEF